MIFKANIRRIIYILCLCFITLGCSGYKTLINGYKPFNADSYYYAYLFKEQINNDSSIYLSLGCGIDKLYLKYELGEFMYLKQINSINDSTRFNDINFDSLFKINLYEYQIFSINTIIQEQLLYLAEQVPQLYHEFYFDIIIPNYFQRKESFKSGYSLTFHDPFAYEFIGDLRLRNRTSYTPPNNSAHNINKIKLDDSAKYVFQYIKNEDLKSYQLIRYKVGVINRRKENDFTNKVPLEIAWDSISGRYQIEEVDYQVIGDTTLNNVNLIKIGNMSLSRINGAKPKFNKEIKNSLEFVNFDISSKNIRIRVNGEIKTNYKLKMTTYFGDQIDEINLLDNQREYLFKLPKRYTILHQKQEYIGRYTWEITDERGNIISRYFIDIK